MLPKVRDGYPLPRCDESVGRARMWVRISLMGDYGEDVLDPALLIMSELVTNADAPRGALSYSRFSREELEGGFWA